MLRFKASYYFNIILPNIYIIYIIINVSPKSIENISIVMKINYVTKKTIPNFEVERKELIL